MLQLTFLQKNKAQFFHLIFTRSFSICTGVILGKVFGLVPGVRSLRDRYRAEKCFLFWNIVDVQPFYLSITTGLISSTKVTMQNCRVCSFHEKPDFLKLSGSSFFNDLPRYSKSSFSVTKGRASLFKFSIESLAFCRGFSIDNELLFSLPQKYNSPEVPNML